MDTWQHIAQVQRFVHQVVAELLARALAHDQSKLEPPEREVFDVFTPRLAEVSYDSPAYRDCLEGMLEHHYAANDHHPQHFETGIGGMGLVQMVEMLCDWKAATLRHADGDLVSSIRVNATRFGYGPELERLLLNTARQLGWV